jgi:hypothetical protein
VQLAVAVILLNYNIKISGFLFYESKISLKLMGTIIIVIDITRKHKRWKCCHKTNMT